MCGIMALWGWLDMAGALTPKQVEFVAQYLVDLNGKQAAIRAGYSAKTAEVQASKLLSNPKVAAEVARQKHIRSERVNITQEMVLEGLLKEAQREDESASHGARVSAYGLLGKHLGLFVDKVESDNNHKVQITVRRVREEPGDNNT